MKILRISSLCCNDTRYVCFRCLQTKSTINNSTKNSNKISYTNTVLLPKSTFPQRHARKRELQIKNEPSFALSYQIQKQSNGDQSSFVLHDGPPYANGMLHFGHAINKILKDIICRRKALEKFNVDFVPGWDCHGLPIEHKVIDSAITSLSPLQVRHKARKLAQEAIELQKESFMNWDVMADWDNPYFTFDSNYMVNQINIFYELYERSLLYKDFLPVYWSPSMGTALAEAELEYNEEHISKSVYVTFKLIDLPTSIVSAINNQDVNAIIWTTTPWTLLANQAIAYTKNHDYCIITIKRFSNHYFLVAQPLVAALKQVFDCQIDIKHIFSGEQLDGVKYNNPFSSNKEKLILLNSNHVSVTKGTGLVHISPNHGLDDYKLIAKHNIKIKECIVDERGVFICDDKHFNGKFVLTDGTESVLEMFGEFILFKEDYKHSYPYDWRSKQPTIIRTSLQWFINTEALRQKCIDSLESVKFYPNSLKNHFINQIEIRPNWCISRQRSWGLPIPVFYAKNDKSFKNPIVNKNIINHISKLFKENGSDCWWQNPIEDLLPPSNLEIDLKLKPSDLIRGEDIFDIWFDSGISWFNALPEPKVADLYLEGMDQIRGWFQSSLFISVALRNCAPYKSVFIHGFALDKDFKKMSKSLGNVIDPNDIIIDKKCAQTTGGVDGLRWWVAKYASDHSNVAVSLNKFDSSSKTIDTFRNTIRFLIGSLNDFSVTTNLCHYNDMRYIDKYLLHLLYNYLDDTKIFYDDYQFENIVIRSTDFWQEIVSAFYFTRIKDRLYCDEQNSVKRRSCQTVLSHLYRSICYVLYPILPHIIKEAETHLKLDDIVARDEWKNDGLAQSIEHVISISKLMSKNSVGMNTINFDCYVKPLTENCAENLAIYQSTPLSFDSNLCELLNVSLAGICESQLPNIDGRTFSASLHPNSDKLDHEILVTNSTNFLCERCRRFTSKNKSNVCSRCSNLLNLL